MESTWNFTEAFVADEFDDDLADWETEMVAEDWYAEDLEYPYED
jgi:hypothetical protein